MGGPPEYHRSLSRQLRRLGLSPTEAPDPALWAQLLCMVSDSYSGSDADRYTMERAIEVSGEEMRSLHEGLTRQARHDALTGLPNRSALAEALGEALTARWQSGRDVAVLFIDLDGFKLVNDTLGHSAGDELLVHAAERICAAVRERDVVARLGGDEFVAVCLDIDNVEMVTAIAQRIATQLAVPFRIGAKDAVVSASVGIALAGSQPITSEDLLREADMAMYQAKTAGHSRYVIFADEMRRSVEGRLATEYALRHAVANDELVLHYQPIVSLPDRRVLSVEALVRWNRPGHGLVYPDSFIPVAEQSRLVTAIDCWVVGEACRQAASWPNQDISVAVNLSAGDLQNSDIVEAMSTALARTGLAPRRLTMELTETTLMSDQASIAANLGRIHALGVQLAIDDFGTGYSSLSYLRRLPARTLKVDRSFVTALDEDDSVAAIISAIVNMGHALGLTVVAEGVEHAGQADRLYLLGCDAAQGYLFAQPRPARDCARYFTAEPVAA